jgi:hypothetical protein
VLGNTAARVWQAPIQIACPHLMLSTSPDRFRVPYAASTTHITTPPMIRLHAISVRLSRFLPMSLVNKNAGIALLRNASV